MRGKRPEYSELLRFSKALADDLNRPCFAYGIKDKRDRKLIAVFEDGSRREYGEDPRQWLLGVGSPKRAAFRTKEAERAFELAKRFFDTDIIGAAVEEAQACLF
jgi:hypothetical protein